MSSTSPFTGRSFPNRAVTENYVLAYPDPVPGWFNIGVLHTSCDGRPGHATYAPCTIGQLKSLGYQYWALGHVHEFEELAWDPCIVFPGNLQGRSVRECGPKGAVLAASLIADITAKLPRGLHANEAQLTDDLDALLNDARALVLGRARQEH